MDNFDKDQIKKAINKFQEEHPLYGVSFDVTKIKDAECIDTISSQIEIIARKLQEDTDMYIVCEMAKKYLEGARPVYPVRPQGEWYFSCEKGWECNQCHEVIKDMPTCMRKAIYNFCPNCGADMRKGEEK